MNLFKKLSLLAFAGLLITTPAFATDEPFAAQIVIKQPITIVETASLDYGIVFATAGVQNIVQAPAVAGAANFTVTGEPSTAITATIVENTGITLAGGASTITVDTFVFGGSLTDAAGSGTATFDAGGALASDASVGATVNIPASPVSATYTGTLTLRVIY